MAQTRHVAFVVQAFYPSTPEERAHWKDVICTRDAKQARETIANINDDPTCGRGRAIVGGIEVQL